MSGNFPWGAAPTLPTFGVDSHALRLLRDGVEAFPAMLGAIAAARVEILVEMYWVGDDAVGARFLRALVEKAHEGVLVRVVVDAVGSLGLRDNFWAPLERAGGLVNVYHPLSPLARSFQLRAIELRDHRKLLVVDGEVGFTGGINLALPWLPREHGGQGFRDEAVEVRGPVVRQLRGLFYKTWQHLTRAKPPADVHPLAVARKGHVWVLANQRTRRGRREILREYLFRVQRAQRTIDLANAYFVPEGAFRHALYGAVRRGVRVRVLVPFRGDVAIVQMAQESLYQDFLDHGLEVYLLRGSVLHSKSAIVDRHFVTLGSYNFDERSRSKNLELNLAVEDPAFATQAEAMFEAYLTSSERLTGEAWASRGSLRRGAELVSFTLRRFL
ncbi:MAG: hypothetical protein IPF92_02330 [Myxococcales bacterium]|nr:hypothetical protein [Myxococcales bacterium]MBL0193965.1 hypothetical protein [Myxococcales bacterium]HQY62045.1 phospholipase D-like domain-containing protein [Polyangiaceae bacterium]